MYKITEYSINQAKKYGYIIKSSSRRIKKIDVFLNGIFLGSIGDTSYSDYPSYIQSHGLDFANERRRLYHIRHRKDIAVVNSLGYIASILLW